MKYLATAMPGPTPVPPERALDLYKAAGEWIRASLEAGRLDCMYTFAEGGGMGIGNAQSHEEVYEMLISYPMYGFFRWEVKPLCDWDRVFTAIEGAFRGGG